MNKQRQEEMISEIQEYRFSDFTDLDNTKVVFRNFEFKDLNKPTADQIEATKKTLKLERNNAAVSGFSISPLVDHYRGLKKHEEDEREDRIHDEVERRVEEIRQAAYQDGFKKGQEDGEHEIFENLKNEVNQRIAKTEEMVEIILSDYSNILEKQKKELYILVRNLTKWVILRELKDDGQYIERLIEKLITEMNLKSNILVQVSEQQFQDTPDLIDIFKEKFKQLKNVRVEIDHDVHGKGIVMQTDIGIIDGSLEEQFSRLDKLFTVVGLEVNE